MKNVKRVRILALFIGFVVSNILLASNAFVSTAQSRSGAPNLEGTEWQKEPDVVAIGTAIADIDRFYAFGGQGKVLLISSAVIGVDYPSRLTGRFPPASAETKVAGRYTQTGNLVHIEFPDATVKATIKGNVLLAEITYKDANKGKEQWVMHRISNNAAPGAKAPSKESTATLSPTLSQQIVEKYKPIPLTTNVISGELRNSGKYHYYTFMAGAGELTLTLSLESYPQSRFNAVQFALFDNNERMLGWGMAMSSPSMPYQKVEKINIPSKQPVLLRITEGVNLEPGKYRLQLDGAFETEAEQKRVSNSSVLSVPTKAISNDKRQAAKTLFAQANDLMTQKKYREAIDIFDAFLQLNRTTNFIQLDLATKDRIISAYISRAAAKLNLQDYQSAIEDYSSVIQLSLYVKMEYDAKKPTTKAPSKKPSSGDPLLDAVEASRAARVLSEENVARNGLSAGYIGRAIAKCGFGDKAGAVEDYRMYCVLMDSSCESAKTFCN